MAFSIPTVSGTHHGIQFVICSQLKYDGFETAAAQLMEAVPKTALGSSERLNHLVSLGLQSESCELML